MGIFHFQKVEKHTFWEVCWCMSLKKYWTNRYL